MRTRAQIDGGWMTRGGGRRRALGLLELMVAVTVLSLALIPLYQVFVRGERVTFRSRVSYMAMHCAREALEEMQALPPSALNELAARGELATIPWERVEGPVNERLFEAWGEDEEPDADEPSYPGEYSRILLKRYVKPLSQRPPLLYRLIVLVKWEEHGEGEASYKRGTGRFETVVFFPDARGIDIRRRGGGERE